MLGLQPVWLGYLVASAICVIPAFWGAFGLTYCLTIRDVADTSQVISLVSLKQRFDATDKVFNAPFFGTVAALAIAASWELKGSVTSRWHETTLTSCWCLSLYVVRMIWDTLYQSYSLSDDRKKQCQMMTHHVLSAVAVFGGLSTMTCHFFACFAICCEVTTVFLTGLFATKMFMTPGKLAGVLITINGVCLWLGFMIFRLVLFPVWLYVYFRDATQYPSETWDTLDTLNQYLWPCVIVFLLILSMVWFVQITNGMVKSLTKADEKEEESAEDVDAEDEDEEEHDSNVDSERGAE